MTSCSRLQTNVLAKFVDKYYSIQTLLTRCTMCYCAEHNLTALQVMRPEQNTALNAKIEKFITAKISRNSLKQGSRTHSVFRQRSSQLQKHSISLSRDVVLAKTVWERIQKIAILKQLQRHLKAKRDKDVGTPFPCVPVPLRVARSLEIFSRTFCFSSRYAGLHSPFQQAFMYGQVRLSLPCTKLKINKTTYPFLNSLLFTTQLFKMEQIFIMFCSFALFILDSQMFNVINS